MANKSRSIAIALYVNAALLAIIALALVTRDGSPGILPAAMAQNQLPIGGGAGVFIVPAQFAVNNFGCYVMDVDRQTICAYQYSPSEHELRLMAARNFRYDRELGNFNTPNPTPNEVKQLVEQEKQGMRVTTPQGDRPPVEPRKPE